MEGDIVVIEYLDQAFVVGAWMIERSSIDFVHYSAPTRVCYLQWDRISSYATRLNSSFKLLALY